MNKKFRFFIIPFLLLAACVSLIYYYFSKPEGEFPHPVYALPESSIAVAQAENINVLFSEIKSAKILEEFSSAGFGIREESTFFDSLFSANEALKEMLAESSALLSMHPAGSGKTEWLLLLQAKKKADIFSLKKMIKALDAGLVIAERNYENEKIYDVKDERKDVIFSFAILNGIIAVSRTPVLTEEAVTTFKKQGRSLSADKKRIKENNQKNKVYISYTAMLRHITSLLKADVHKDFIAPENFADYAEYEWKTAENMLSFSGSIFSDKDEKTFSSIFKGMQPGKMEIIRIIPNNCTSFSAFHVSSHSEFSGRYNDYLGKPEKGYTAGWIGNEWAVCRMETGDAETDSLVKVVYVSAKDTLFNSDSLKKFSITHEKESTYRDYRIFMIDHGNEVMQSLAAGNDENKNVFAAYVENYVLLSSSENALKKSIDNYLENQTFSSSASAKSFLKNFSTQSNFFFYINTQHAAASTAKYFNETQGNLQKHTENLLKKFESAGFLISGGNEEVFSQFIISKPSSSEVHVEQEWSYHLDAEITGKPSVVSHSLSTLKEIFVQDEKLNLYCLSTEGKLLWKKNIDDKLSGEVKEISLHADGNMQYLFATKKSLYIVDKRGENAGNYPIHLGANATSSPAVFDFGQTKEYKYYIGTQNNRICGYEAGGKPLSGWNPQASDAPLVFPIKSCRIKDKNYLYGVSNRGTFYLWDEAGEKILKPYECKRKPASEVYLRPAESLDKSAFYFADTTGAVVEIFPSAKATRYITDATAKPFSFMFLQGEKNLHPYCIISSGKNIYVYEKGGKRYWKVKSESINDLPVAVSVFGGKEYIAYGNSAQGKIYVSDFSGNKLPGTPVKGNTPFVFEDISRNGTPDLLCGAKGGMLYLYKIK